MTDSLFPVEPRDRPAPQPADANAPLAERMRPRTLDEVVGQSHLLGPGKPLRAAIGSVPPFGHATHLRVFIAPEVVADVSGGIVTDLRRLSAPRRRSSTIGAHRGRGRRGRCPRRPGPALR